MKKVLRVGSYPTSQYKSMGMNSYMISGMDSVKTHFVTPKYSGTLFPEPLNTFVISLPFLVTPAPKGIKRIYHEFIRILKILTFSLRTLIIFIKEKHDIVHIHSPMFFLIALICRIFGARCYITFHGNEHEFIYRNRFIGKIFNKVFFKTFALSSNISSYGNLYPDYVKNYEVINNAIDTDIFFNRKIIRKKMILAVGRLEKQKDYPTLLKSFKIFLKKNSNYELVIVGSGQEKEKLNELIKEYDIVNSVTLLGHLDHDALPEIYNNADIFVLCSLWEGFPKVLLEAMASGCKVVATRVDSIPRVLGKNYPYLTSPGNFEDLSIKLQLILKENEGFRSSYSKIIENYSWDKTKMIMENHYNSSWT